MAKLYAAIQSAIANTNLNTYFNIDNNINISWTLEKAYSSARVTEIKSQQLLVRLLLDSQSVSQWVERIPIWLEKVSSKWVGEPD